MNVCAALVTYNRKALLVECIHALLAQTHPLERIFVVDNASTDGTEEHLRERGLLEDARLEYTRLPENLGGAGGFARALEIARAHESDWIWAMDDDAAPRPDALERLLAAPPGSDPGVACVTPRVVFPSGAVQEVMRGDFRRRLRPLPAGRYRDGEYPAIDVSSFVGPLYRTSAVRAIDPPRAEFFVWGDDIEYSLRLRREGSIRLVPEAVVVHNAESQSHTNRRSRFWNSILPVRLYPTPLDRFWQNLHGLRNYIWIKREYEHQSAVSAAGTTLQFLVKHVLHDEQPFRRVPWILRFARDGRRGRFENIAPAEWRRIIGD